jgi:hypothetical protein
MTTFTWLNDASGNWTDINAWNPSGGPQNGGDSALINATGTAYTINYGIASLQISGLSDSSSNATINMTSGVLQTNSLLAAGTIAVGSGTTLTVFGAGTVSGEIQVSGSASIGTLTLNSGALLNVSGGTLASSTAITIASGATAELSSGASVQTGSLSLNGMLEEIGGIGTHNPSGLGGTGTILANAGTIVIQSANPARASVNLIVGNSAQSEIEVAGQLFFGDVLRSTFLGNQGAVYYAGPASSGITFGVTGLNVGATQSNFLDLKTSGVTISAGGTGSATTGTITLSNGDTINATGITNVGTAGWRASTASDGNGGTDIFLTPLCYVAGTHILTGAGEVMIENLHLGDRILARFGRDAEPLPVLWVGRRRIDLQSHPRPEVVAPIRIRRHAVADDVPHRDLLVSPDHGILIDGKLICARQLVNGATILRDMRRTVVEYYHIELAAHAILLAEGLPAESYIDTGNRGFFENADAPMILHPDLHDISDLPTREANSCMPFVSDAATVRPVWLSLARRAANLGFAVLPVPTTPDPDLRVVANGQTCRRLRHADGRSVYILPRGASDVRLMSRSASPTDTKPWLNDQRRLGVCVARILLHEPGEEREIPVDHPALTQGWYDVEFEGETIHRWTRGDATLRLPPMPAPRLLEIRASGLIYPIISEAGSSATGTNASLAPIEHGAVAA